jgi:hypothetical protein
VKLSLGKTLYGAHGTPHDTVPFDRLQFEDFEEAFMEAFAATTNKSRR